MNDVNTYLNIHLSDQDISFELYAEILNQLKAKQDNELIFQDRYKPLLSEWLYTINQVLIDHNPLRYTEGEGLYVLHDKFMDRSIKLSSEINAPFVLIESLR